MKFLIPLDGTNSVAILSPHERQEKGIAGRIMATSTSNAKRSVKGPLVWLDMDQKELDDAYDQSVYAPNQPFITTRRRLASEAMLKRVTPERIAYGSSEDEKLDIYKTSQQNAPINIFIHGGAWRNGQARDSAYLAEMFINAGAHFVIPDFVQVHNAGGNLMPMARQVRSAVAWVLQERRDVSAAIRISSTSPGIPPARISPDALSSPIGRKISACLRTLSRADFWSVVCTI